ncbi:NUDIX hydrolase [Candidatus Entotheonella palauensis]|uniref:NUDIX hydrolase n=1 Tax=Candidatus Entotheonella palauensis TaxID=93172 RepID=UPI000B7EEDBC|nr:NUDIX hydrolase [Candidatus Entotheonella palauensis]
MDNEIDWTKRYRLVAGVYAMRGSEILILERAAGMMLGFWSVPGGHVDPGETPQQAAVRELFEEAGIAPTGPLWLVATVPLKGYGMDLLSIRYACECDAGEVRLSHEHSGAAWVEPLTYRDTHLSGQVEAQWRQSAEEDAFNVRSNRDGLNAFLHWREQMRQT